MESNGNGATFSAQMGPILSEIVKLAGECSEQAPNGLRVAAFEAVLGSLLQAWLDEHRMLQARAMHQQQGRAPEVVRQ